MLNDIEVLDQPDTNYWTATGSACPIRRTMPSSRRHRIQAGAGDPQRSAIVHHQHPQRRHRTGGDAGFGRAASPSAAIAALPASICRSMAATAGSRPSSVPDQGTYGFRQWQTPFTLGCAARAP